MEGSESFIALKIETTDVYDIMWISAYMSLAKGTLLMRCSHCRIKHKYRGSVHQHFLQALIATETD